MAFPLFVLAMGIVAALRQYGGKHRHRHGHRQFFLSMHVLHAPRPTSAANAGFVLAAKAFRQ